MSPSVQSPVSSAVHELDLDGFAHGGEAVGRRADGKACFVGYALPGERVRVEIVEEAKRWSRGRLLEVVQPSAERVEPPCPHFGPQRCGGCQLQHASAEGQERLVARVVREQLERIGRLEAPPVLPTITPAPFAYRTRARFGVDEQGRLGFRRAGTHDLVAIDRCPLLTGPAQALRERAGDHWVGVKEVEVRVGLASGETALVVTPGAGGMPGLPATDDPVALRDDSGATVALRGDPTIHEEVAGRRFRISPASFFQSSVVAAEVLSDLVVEAAAPDAGTRALDLHAGVGLFAAALGRAGAEVVAVEKVAAAAADAWENLADVDAEVIAGDALAVTRERAEEAVDVVVLDPPRRGAGDRLCRALAATPATTVVYVSCDPAALARDARLLVDAGFRLEQVQPVDQFAQTAAVEAVATFRR